MARYRVLVLHDSYGAFPQSRLKMLETVVTREGYRAPSFQIRSYRIALYVSILAIFSLLTTICALLFVKYDLKVARIVTMISAGSFFLVSLVLKYSVELIILKKAIQMANNTALDFKPNLILAQGYGAKVALRMNKPRVPLILMSPIIHERFAPTLCAMRARYTEFPFVLILHGYKDAHNPIINSVRLSGRFDRNKVKLDVLECDNYFSTLTPDVIHGWLDEAYDKGRVVVEELAESGCDYVDKSLFSDSV